MVFMDIFFILARSSKYIHWNFHGTQFVSIPKFLLRKQVNLLYLILFRKIIWIFGDQAVEIKLKIK
jgi:hypothetical protein